MNKLIYAVALSVSVTLMGVNSGMAEAAATRNVTLKWAAANSTQQVIGYEVYFGKTADQTKMRLLPTPSTMNLAAPAARFDVLRDLVTLPGQTACFRLKALNNTSKSAFSPAVCATI